MAASFIKYITNKNLSKTKLKLYLQTKKRQHISSNHEPHRTFCPVKRQVYFDRLSFLRYNHVFRFLKKTRVRKRFLFFNGHKRESESPYPAHAGLHASYRKK